ncbi:PmoA family protein [Galbibacter sp. BG1]|uniref:DUF6807 family protein n=1 Tax=Galbibacter sp. BG1 TaxID=1170699 RepID=UPI0015BA97C4|nr:DUF6807 family protein [Galbibacter sp. BG1]QLE02407.1 PmoA family protein [Galbibacter sp. BG1]
MKPQFFLLLIISLLAVEVCHAQFKVEEKEGGILILEGSQKVFFYQQQTKSIEGKFPRANYIHPLYQLDGTVLTEDFPEDHPHHRGVFWSWHQTMVDGKQMGDAWLCEDFTWQVTEMTSEENKNGSLTLHTQVDWLSSGFQGGNAPFVKEKAAITVYPATDTYRIIDFEINLLALVANVKIGGSNDVKGYGGFSTRVNLPEDITFTSGRKKIKLRKEAITAKNYMDISGSFGNGSTSGMIIVSSYQNPEPNNYWILRDTNSMQNAVYPGRKPVLIDTKRPTVLKYRLILYAEKLSKEELKNLTDF